jgi:hypothetical protein
MSEEIQLPGSTIAEESSATGVPVRANRDPGSAMRAGRSPTAGRDDRRPSADSGIS